MHSHYSHDLRPHKPITTNATNKPKIDVAPIKNGPGGHFVSYSLRRWTRASETRTVRAIRHVQPFSVRKTQPPQIGPVGCDTWQCLHTAGLSGLSHSNFECPRCHLAWKDRECFDRRATRARCHLVDEFVTWVMHNFCVCVRGLSINNGWIIHPH